VVAHVRRVGELSLAHSHHDVLEAVRYVGDIDEPDHARRALERVCVPQHLVDELAVRRIALERDDALVQPLE